MPTLHKFKLLATHCAVAGSSTPSPTASPVIHFRHRKTLRMLLNRPDRRRFSRCEGESEFDDIAEDPKEMNYKEARVRRKLKDLFVSSPPIEDKRCELEEQQELLPSAGGSVVSGRVRNRLGGAASLRPVSGAFRYRFLRRAWRPMLVTIPE